MNEVTLQSLQELYKNPQHSSRMVIEENLLFKIKVRMAQSLNIQKKKMHKKKCPEENSGFSLLIETVLSAIPPFTELLSIKLPFPKSAPNRAQSPFNPVRCNSPNLSRGHNYQSADIDSGIISLNSSTCSSECYESRRDCHCPEKKEGLRTKWLKSENRRCALAGTLSGAHNALEHQKDCLKKQETEILSSKEALENLLLKHEFLASKVSQLRDEKLDQKSVAQQSSEGEHNQKHRITVLEEKVKDIIQKIDRDTLNRKTSTTSSISDTADGGNDYTEEVKNVLQHHIQQLSVNLNSTQQEKETLERHLTSLHSELFQAKITTKKLEKDILGLQSELSASRNINENLLLEATSLRRDIQSLSESKKVLETEWNLLDVRIKDLEIEKQQLVSQNDLLLKSLKAWRRGNTAEASDQSERHCNKCIVLQKQLEKLKTELGVCTRNHGQRKTEFQDHSSTSQSPREQSERSHKIKREKSCKMGRRFNTENIKQKWTKLVSKQILPKGREDQLPLSQSPAHLIQPLVNYRLTPELKNRGQDHNKQVFMHRNGSKWQKDHNDYDTKNRKPMRKTRSRDNITRTEDSRQDHHEYCSSYPQLSTLLKRLEDLLTINDGVEKEKHRIMKNVVKLLKEIKDAESFSEQSRKQVEDLLNEHLYLKEKCHLRENQITAVIIELKNLRKAYHGMLCHVNLPQAINSVDWISKVQLVKKSLEILKCHQQKTKLLEKEINWLKVQLQHKALKQQEL
uniref:Uncharacterized protein LOC117346450 isoform X2 n=1 Tax=Geotrypetes seraphini TaxID=260995 RepID=A0A6P8NST3_GEOSA|nr:uncharacterized protein LOC117346450 isoform X2 [Geotrypetes seraphini]